MGLDIENDAGILKHYNVTNVEKSPCFIENTTSNSKIIIFQNKIAIITFCEMLDGEFAEWIEVMRYRHSYKTHMYIISNKMRLENNEFVRYCSTLTKESCRTLDNFDYYSFAGISMHTWKSWVSSSRLYDFSIEETDSLVIVTFFRNEAYGDWEYSNGYRKVENIISINKDYINNPVDKDIRCCIDHKWIIIEENNPY